MTPESRIADALKDHFRASDDNVCCGETCDWEAPEGADWRQSHMEHLAAVIVGLSDIAVVDLPAATEWHGEQVYPVHLEDRDEAFVEIRPDGSIGSSGISNPMRDVSRAGAYGAAILAAARAAEATS